MMHKRIILIVTIVALVAAVGLRLTFLSAHASPILAPGIQDSASPTDPVVPVYEYKILVFGSWAASRKTLGYGPTGYTPPNLEDEINKLAEQGFVVDRFQTSTLADGWGNIATSSEIVVLLKRAKK